MILTDTYPGDTINIRFISSVDDEEHGKFKILGKYNMKTRKFNLVTGDDAPEGILAEIESRIRNHIEKHYPTPE